MTNSSKTFLQYDVDSPELLRRAVPPSVLPKLSGATFLWHDKIPNNPYQHVHVIFTDKRDAILFAQHYNNGEAVVDTSGHNSTPKEPFTVAEREVKYTRTSNIQSEVVRVTVNEPQAAEHYIESPTTHRSQESVTIYSVGIRGKHLTPEIIEKAFGTKVYDKSSLHEMQQDLITKAEKGLALPS